MEEYVFEYYKSTRYKEQYVKELARKALIGIILSPFLLETAVWSVYGFISFIHELIRQQDFKEFEKKYGIKLPRCVSLRLRRDRRKDGYSFINTDYPMIKNSAVYIGKWEIRSVYIYTIDTIVKELRKKKRKIARNELEEEKYDMAFGRERYKWEKKASEYFKKRCIDNTGFTDEIYNLLKAAGRNVIRVDTDRDPYLILKSGTIIKCIYRSSMNRIDEGEIMEYIRFARFKRAKNAAIFTILPLTEDAKRLAKGKKIMVIDITGLGRLLKQKECRTTKLEPERNQWELTVKDLDFVMKDMLKDHGKIRNIKKTK